MKILTNHIGYSAAGEKKVVVQCREGEVPETFTVLDEFGTEVFTAPLAYAGPVDRWEMGTYYTGTFCEITDEGTYRIKVGNDVSPDFEVRRFLITMRMINAVSYYFKAQRSSGEWLHEDRTLRFNGPREGCLDVHGGWYDASGDVGIHLSHLSHSSYCNPQQHPLSAYLFFKAHERVCGSGNEYYTMLSRRLLDEGYWGADFLMRMHVPNGSFLLSIKRINPLGPVQGSRMIDFEYRKSSNKVWAKTAEADEEVITDERYEASLRSGGGMAIAALAAAGRNWLPSSDYSQEEYLQCAKQAWHHLLAHNERYTNDGEWNLVDEYCALTAASELYKTTKEYEYLVSARTMARRIIGRSVEVADGMRRLEVADGIPFYHASDEGLPIVALLGYVELETDERRRQTVIRTAEELMRWKIHLTKSVTNPFGYPRLECLEEGKLVGRFFFPHTSAAAPWWQGDNARLSSLASAAMLVASVTDDERLSADCKKMAQDPLDWIMGLNPYDSSMIEGYGRNNIQYFFKGRYDFLNCPGGIVNGITSGIEDEHGIEFVSEPDERVDDNWRWGEQWIPHASWFLLAMALKQE